MHLKVCKPLDERLRFIARLLDKERGLTPFLRMARVNQTEIASIAYSSRVAIYSQTSTIAQTIQFNEYLVGNAKGIRIDCPGVGNAATGWHEAAIGHV